MNKETKRYLIKTNFCEIKLTWNSTVVFSHCAVLLALLLIDIFGTNKTIKSGCIALFALYIVGMIFIICKSASVKDITNKQPVSKEKPAEVVKAKQSKPQEEKKPVKKAEPEIRNKVGVPEEEKKEQVASPELEAPVQTKRVSDMPDDYWQDLFKML